MLSFKYKNGVVFNTTLEGLLAVEPRDWVGVDCESLTVDEDYAYAIDLPRHGVFVGSELLELLVKWGISPGTPRPWCPSQRELKDLVEHVLMMPVDLRDRMGITVLPTIPTKAVWRLNHQADPSMGWWGVMETRAGLSWGMLHPGRGVTYREVAEWLGMKAVEMPFQTGRDAPYNGQRLQPIDGDKTFDAATPLRPQLSPVTDSGGCPLAAGDYVVVNDTISIFPSGTTARVSGVNPRKGRVKLEGYWNWVDPKLCTLAGTQVVKSPDLLPVLVRYIQSLKHERIASLGLEVKYEMFPDREEIWVVTMPAPRPQGCRDVLKHHWSARIHLNQYGGNTIRMTDGTRKAPAFAELVEMLGLYLQHDLPTQLLVLDPLVDRRHPDLLDWSTGIREGDTVEVVKDEQPGFHVVNWWKVGERMAVDRVEVRPWGIFLRNAEGRNLNFNRAGKVAVQQEGRGTGSEAFKAEALAHYLRAMPDDDLIVCGISTQFRTVGGLLAGVKVCKRGGRCHDWSVSLNRDADTGAWSGNGINWLCKKVGLDFRLDLLAQFERVEPRAAQLWPELFPTASCAPVPCHDIDGTAVKVGDIVAVEIADVWYKTGVPFVVRDIRYRDGVGRVVDSEGYDCPARHVRVVAEKVQPEASPDPCTQILCDLQEQLREIMRRVDEAIDARG